MKSEGGVSIIPCKVNGLNLNFIFDTGASDVSISLTEASFMLKNGYLDKSDIIGTSKYLDANGNINEGVTINLKEIEIAGLKLYDVKASIIKNIKAPLLLGQSAISKLGRIEIDLELNTITIVKENGNSNNLKYSESSSQKINTPSDINQIPKSDSDYFQNGIARTRVNDYEGAIVDFTKAIEINPRYEDAYYFRAISKGFLSDYSGAIKDYDKVIEINPNNSEAYCFRGTDKANNKDYKGGISDLNKSILMNPKSAASYSCRGEIKSQQKDYPGAILDYTKAIQLDPQNPDYYQNRAYTKGETKDFVGALADYNKAIQLGTEDYIAYLNRGNAKVQLKNYKSALTDYNKSIEINSKSATTYYARGIAKEKLDDYEGAISDYDKALENDSSFYMASIMKAFAIQHLKENDWLNVLTQNGQKWFIKSEYVYKEGAIIKIWIKEEIKSKSFVIKGKNMNYINVKMLMLLEFDCNSRQSKSYSTIYYDSKGNVLYRSNEETDWEDITPETILETVFNKTCEKFK